MKRIIYTLILATFILQLQAQKKLAFKISTIANMEYNNMRYAYAIPLYKAYIKRAPNDTSSLKNLADSYAKVNQYDSAVLFYERAAANGANTGNKIPELYALLGNYNKAIEGYRQSMALSKSRISDMRLTGFTNRKKFLADSINYNLYYTKLNTAFNEFNAVFYKNGLVFESNRTPKVNARNEFGWDGSSYTNLYYLDHLDSIRTDSIQVVKWKDKKIINVFDDLTRATSNDSRTIISKYDFKKLSYNTANVVPFGSEFDSKLNVGAISFTKDGLSAYYTRNQKNSKGVYQLEIWETNYVNGKWTSGYKLFFNNPAFSYFHPAITPDGKRLYYVSDEIGGNGGTDIYFIDRNEDGSWKNTKNAGQEINTEGNELFPTFNEGKLYFSSNGHPGLGGLDIYTVEVDKFKTLSVKNMGYPINSDKDDLAFAIKGNTGFFTSNRYGTDDILAFDYTKQLIKLTGKLLVNNKLAPAIKILLYSTNEKGKRFVVDSTYTDANGLYTFNVNPNQTFIIAALDKEGNRTEQAINSEDYIKNRSLFEKGLANLYLEAAAPLKVIESGKQSFKSIIDSLKAISHDYVLLHHPFDKTTIVQHDMASYRKLVKMVKKTSNQQIIIVSATDCNGSIEYNQNLSLRRAKRLNNTLSKLSNNQIAYINVGEGQLLEACIEGKKAKKAQEVNRYSFVFIIKQ